MKPLMRSALAVAAAVVLAACGSSNSSSSSTTTAAAASSTTPNAAKATAAQVAAVQCIRAHGINIPDPASSTGSKLSVAQILAGYPRAKVLAAEKACTAQINAASPQTKTLSKAQKALRLHVVSIFAACMRAHGIAFPDPSLGTKNPGALYQALQKLDTTSPAYQSAAATCKAQALKASRSG